MSNGDVLKLVRDFEAGAQQGNGNFSLVYADLLEMKHSGASKDQLNRELYQVNCALVQDGAIPVSTAGGLPQFILIDADSHGHIITANPATQQMEARDLNLNVLGTVTPTYGDPYRQGYPQQQYDGQGRQYNPQNGYQNWQPQYYPQNDNLGYYSQNDNLGYDPQNDNLGYNSQNDNLNYNSQLQNNPQNDNLGYNSQYDNQGNQGYNSGQNNPQYGDQGYDPRQNNPQYGDQGYDPQQNNQQNDNYQYDGSGQQSCPADQQNSGQGDSQAPHYENWSNREFYVQADGSARYTVAPGDTVSAVADDVLIQRLGRRPSQTEIMNEVNVIAQASGIADANKIWPGNILLIPAADGRVEQPQPTNGPNRSNYYQQPTHPVQIQQPTGSTSNQLQALGLDPNNTTDKIVEMLSQSEGGPQSINWNDVGQGISVGMYQANQDGGPLCTLFQAMFKSDPTEFRNIFQENTSAMLDQNQLKGLHFASNNRLGQQLQQAMQVQTFQKAELDLDRQRINGFAADATKNYGVTSAEGIALYCYMMNWGPALAQKYFAAAKGQTDQNAKIQAVMASAQSHGDSDAVTRINTTMARADQLGLDSNQTQYA